MVSKLSIGLALGSGSSRGWSHIGVVKALVEMGVEPDIVCGTSIGALVGGAFVANKMDELEQWACSLSKFETARYFEINTSLRGFVNVKKLHEFLDKNVASNHQNIEDLAKKYAAVSTDLESGREIWLTEGLLLEAIWSSISLPGLFPPIRKNNKWLVDGGLVNPVPVSVCRALGADVVIAVNLNGDIVGKHWVSNKQKTIKVAPKKAAGLDSGFGGKITDFVRDYTSAMFSEPPDKQQPPNLFDAIAGSVNIMQDKITRSRIAGDPPDILISPKLSHIGLLEFYRASESIEEGKKAVFRQRSAIEDMLVQF